MSNDKTPESGESKVTISFSNAKDINNNDIEINSCSKTYDFKEYDTYYVPSDDKKEELPTEDLTNTSTYISSLKIKGCEIDFDKEIG